MKSEISGISYRETEKGDIEQVLSLILSSPDALLSVTQEEMLSWIEKNLSMVAINQDNVIVGHQAASVWPQSQWIEMRAAIVSSEYRGLGINTEMKAMLMRYILKILGAVTFIGFTEAASKSRGILKNSGYKELPLSETPEEFFSVCPPNCFKKTGAPCGCKVYIKHSDASTEEEQ